MTKHVRCDWSLGSDLMRKYHDTEWGVPLADDQPLFEFLILEGAQAGLSWSTILKKRENYRRLYAGFDPEEVALFGETDIARLLSDPGIVRNRLKVRSSVSNAVAFLKVAEEFGSFASYIWTFVDGKPVRNQWKAMSDIPAATETASILSRDLKKRGFKFVGPTICYSHMQAVGMVNDHIVTCYRYEEIDRLARDFWSP